MHTTYALTSGAALLVFGALAHSESDYSAWMKSNPANMGSLNKNIAITL
jgi:hypothetical protein